MVVWDWLLFGSSLWKVRVSLIGAVLVAVAYDLVSRLVLRLTLALASPKVRCSLVFIARTSFSNKYLGQVLDVTLWGSLQFTQLVSS